MILIFIRRVKRGYVRRSWNNFLEYDKVFQKIGVVLATEQSRKTFTFIFQRFCLNFKSMIFKECINDFWCESRREPYDGCF